MRMISLPSLLPALLLAAWLPAQAQRQEPQEPARSSGSIAGKAATTRTVPSGTTKAAAERKRLQLTAGTAAAATAQSTRPVASPATPATIKDKSHCHSSGSDA
jgi:hypothetical protein